MSESLTEPKKHLALDTDRGSAAGMILLFVMCGLFAATTASRIVHGTQPTVSASISWRTWFLLVLCPLWFFGTRERLLRILCLVVAIGPVSRVLLWLLKAPLDTLIANVAFLRVIDLMLFVAVCVYIPCWFKSKVRHV
jgi:hypothetical protein